MKPFKYLVFAFALLFADLRAYGQAPAANDIAKKIDALVPERVTKDSPGLVVGVVQNGKLVFAKGYGMANLAYKIPNDDKLVYNIGSVSKQFLGYAFAMLHVEGKLNIDDPVSKYLDDWPEFDHKVTLRHLLTHTSGYREAYTMSTLAGRMIGVDRLSRNECLEVVRRQKKLEFTPGSKYVYNSTAWVILAEVLQKVTGKTASGWVTDQIFKPLAMNDTQIEDQVGDVIQNAAESYSATIAGYVNAKSNRAIFGAADIFTSVQDMAKWLDNFRTAKVGGKQARELFLEPFTLNDGTSAEYGLGIRVRTYRGLKEYSHTGGHEAFVTQLAYFPEYDTGIFTVSNAGRLATITNQQIADVVLAKHLKEKKVPKTVSKVKVSPKVLQQFAGNYLLESQGRTHQLSVVDKTLTLDGRMKLVPITENSFRIEGSDALVSFQSNGKMKITVGKNTLEFESYKPWKTTRKELSVYKGDYWCEELETIYHLKVDEQTLIINHRWLGDVKLEPIKPDLFRVEFGIIRFQRNEKREITGFGVSTARTSNVEFAKVKKLVTK